MSNAASEFARGWRIVAGSAMGISIGVSSLYFYSLGIFVKPMAAEFGWGRGAASLGALVGTAGAALMAIPVGRLVDRIGSLKIAVGSLCILAAGFVALGALTSGLAAFLVVTALLSLLSAGSTPLPYTRLIVGEFQQQRGMALGLTLAGTGVGALAIPTLLTPFISNHGWRAGYFALAVVIAVCLPVTAWLISSAKEGGVNPDPDPSRPRLAYNDSFRLLALIFFLVSTAILGSVVHFVPMLTDWGLSPAKAGATAGLIGVTTIGGRLLVGALLDRAPPLAVTVGVFLIVACGFVALDLGGPAYAILGALVLGLAIGAEVDLIAFLVGLYFPRAQYGQAYGAIYAMFLTGGAIGPALTGYLQEMTGDYRLSLLCDAGLLCVAAALTSRLVRPGQVPHSGEHIRC